MHQRCGLEIGYFQRLDGIAGKPYAFKVDGKAQIPALL